jgi:cellulose synthase/poly-beta-1,6-N-acetylglucosamine synthase-like glycosyltransferase
MIAITLQYIFWASAICFALSWFVYPVLLAVCSRGKQPGGHRTEKRDPDSVISVIIAAHNEAGCIRQRIENLLGLKGNFVLDIIVGSDGSTDETVEIVHALNHPQASVIDFAENRGRAEVHNDCSAQAKGDLLVFTDAETMFAPNFLELIVPYFDDPRVGVVSGRIAYLNENTSDLGYSAGTYWKLEEFIRVAESRLGILGFGTGAALAMRREAYENIGSSEDIDYAETLAVASKGYLVKYEPQARAFDFISETLGGAFKTRIRQTSRCFKSVIRRIFSYPILLKRPGVFFAALMHKTFRHITPAFMLLMLVTNLFLYDSHWLYTILFLLQLVYYHAALAGILFQNHFGRWLKPILSLTSSFLLVNISRGIGVYKALRNLERATYKTVR